MEWQEESWPEHMIDEGTCVYIVAANDGQKDYTWNYIIQIPHQNMTTMT